MEAVTCERSGCWRDRVDRGSTVNGGRQDRRRKDDEPCRREPHCLTASLQGSTGGR